MLWLGDKRGYLSDWLTHRWVRISGWKLNLVDEPWLDGPTGSSRQIGRDFFVGYAKGHSLETSEDGTRGLIQSFRELSLDGPREVAPPVRDFYEQTSEYELDARSEWHGLFRPFGRAMALIFSRRLQQLNVPLSSLDSSKGMTSAVLQLSDSISGRVVRNRLGTDVVTLSRKCGASDGCSKNWKAVGTADFDHDDNADVLWHKPTTGEVQVWLMNSARSESRVQTLSLKCGAADGCSKTWRIIGAADLNGDGHADVFWQNITTGVIQVWLMDPTGHITRTQAISRACGASDACASTWKVVAIGDFNQDSFSDLLWQNKTTGELVAWLLNDYGHVLGTLSLSARCGTSAQCPQTSTPLGVGEFTADGIPDLLWYDLTAGLFSWDMGNMGVLKESTVFRSPCGTSAGCAKVGKPIGVFLHYYHLRQSPI